MMSSSSFVCILLLSVVASGSASAESYTNLTEGWFNPEEFTPIYSQCSRYGAKFRPAEGLSCSDYKYTIKANLTSIEATDIEVSTSYEESILICIVSFPVPIMKNQPIKLDLLAARSKPFEAIYCLCDLTPHYVDILPQVKNVTATVSCDLVNITWTIDVLEGYEINEYAVTISELKITLEVADPYVVFNLTTSDGFGVLRPNSLYNVTVEPIYCGGAEIGDSSSAIISTNFSSFVSKSLTYTVQNVSDSSAFLQFQSVVQVEVCVSSSVLVKLDCEGQIIKNTSEVFITPEHTILVNATVPVDKTCIATLKWMIKDIVVLSHKVILNTYRLYLSNIVGPVFTNHSAEMKQECLISCCSADSAAPSDSLPHLQNSFSLTEFQCDSNFYTKCYTFDYSPTNEPEPSSCSTSTATVTMTVTIHSNSSSSVIPGCEYCVIGLSVTCFSILLLMVLTFGGIAVAIFFFRRCRQDYNLPRVSQSSGPQSSSHGTLPA